MITHKLQTGGFEYPREIQYENSGFLTSLADENIRRQIAPSLSKSAVEQHLAVIKFCKERGEYLADGRIVKSRAEEIYVDVLEFTNASKTDTALKFGEPTRTLESHNLHKVVKEARQARKDSLGQVIKQEASQSLGQGLVITGPVSLTRGIDDYNLEIDLDSKYLQLTYNFSTYPTDGGFDYSARLNPGRATSERAVGFKIESLLTMHGEKIERTTHCLVPQFIKVPGKNDFKLNGFKTSITREFLLARE